MEREIKVWLSDIKQAISEINQFLPDKRLKSETCYRKKYRNNW